MRSSLLFFLLISNACTEHKLPTESSVVEVSELAKEQQIPKQILAEVDGELKEEFKSNPPIYAFLPLQVEFTEMQSGILKKPKMKYVFPKGGGQVNLNDLVTGDGSFYMHFPKEQFDPANELLHIYFVSNSPRVKIENENFGLGCGKWNDLKPGFKKMQNDDYLKLNTTDLRYLRVLAGTYVFVFKQGKNIFLSQLTITHSGYVNELCAGGLNNES